MKISKSWDDLYRPEQNLLLLENVWGISDFLLPADAQVTTHWEWEDEEEIVIKLLHKIYSQKIRMFHFFHYWDFKLGVVDVLLLLKKFMLLQHFNSIVFISGRNLAQEHLTKSTFAYNCKKLEITNLQLEMSELRRIRNLSYNKDVERSVAGDDFVFNVCFFSFFIIGVLHDSEVRNSHHHLNVLRSVW